MSLKIASDETVHRQSTSLPPCIPRNLLSFRRNFYGHRHTHLSPSLEVLFPFHFSLITLKSFHRRESLRKCRVGVMVHGVQPVTMRGRQIGDMQLDQR